MTGVCEQAAPESRSVILSGAEAVGNRLEHANREGIWL